MREWGRSDCFVGLRPPRNDERIFLAITIFLAFFFALYPIHFTPAAEDVKLKMTVTNPSETEERTVPVKSYLPKGIRPEDITDKGNFEIGYDFEKSLYYAYQEVTLKPDETVTLEIDMEDVWRIPTEDIIALQEYVSKTISALQKTKYDNQAKALGGSIDKRLDKILERQKEENPNIEQRFSDYEEDITLLKEAKRDVAILEDLGLETGVLEGKEMMGENPNEAAYVRTEEAVDDLEKLGSVKFNIEISNPSDDKKTIPLKYYFPAEVKQEYVVNSGGLETGYDYQRGLSYVYKDAIELAPKETKEYIVEVKDIWTISEEHINNLREYAESLLNVLDESEYNTTAVALGNKIKLNLDGILATQKDPSANIGRHIADYRIAIAKLDEVNRDTARLEKLVIKSGGTPGLILSGAGGKVRGAKGLEIVGKSIFRGKAPNMATTWRIIYSIIGFLGLSTLLFIVLQFQQRRSVMFDALTGAFRREYILERLKEEFLITQRAGNKCSILLSDIDKFKSINDTYGHAAGDSVLKEFVIALRQGLRNADFIGRLGGDEFLVILSYADKERAQLIAEKLRKIVFDHPIKLKDRTINITPSIGVASFPDDARTVKDLVGKADKAMYKVKGGGGNGIAV